MVDWVYSVCSTATDQSLLLLVLLLPLLLGLPVLLLLCQSIQGPRDEILVAFFSKDLKSATAEEKDLLAAVAAQDAEAVQAALAHVSAAHSRPWLGLQVGLCGVRVVSLVWDRWCAWWCGVRGTPPASNAAHHAAMLARAFLSAVITRL